MTQDSSGAPARNNTLRLRSLAASQTLVALIMSAPVAILACAAWSRRWMSDDGYIYLRVVDQVLAGHGPVFNQGERVETATSPLWVVVLALGESVARPVPAPWIAVSAGMSLSVLGLALAELAAYRIWRTDGRTFMFPLGALIIVALPPFWDFATSGLETGLAFAWLGGTFLGFVRLYDSLSLSSDAQRGRGMHASVLLLVVGLGPLIRPDFAVFSLAFLALFFCLRPHLSWTGRFISVAWALAPAMAYEVFRSGYYAALVPNPAFAKEASTMRWTQGWRYLADMTATYWLAVPLLLIAGLAAATWLSSSPAERTRRSRLTPLVVTPIAAALLHALYVVAIGGDFMHARLLLPAVFAALMPVSVIAVETRVSIALALGVGAWAVVCATTLRVPYGSEGSYGITDERAYHVEISKHRHPVTPEDYRPYFVDALAFAVRANPPHGLLVLESGARVALAKDVSEDAVVEASQIGIYGYVVGTGMHVIDAHGLAEPVGGRLELPQPRGRPGHEKRLPEAWMIARFGDPDADVPGSTSDAASFSAARTALSCGDLHRLVDGVTASLSPRRFVGNIVLAFRLHRFRVPRDPFEARARIC